LYAQGGLFILEPQPWRSYRAAFRKQEMPEELKHVLPTLQIRPEQFARVLRQEVGFAHVEPLAPPAGSAEGFDRPLLLCRKSQ
jgi:7SK snRNA methylphosphate capping enzyme